MEVRCDNLAIAGIKIVDASSTFCIHFNRRNAFPTKSQFYYQDIDLLASSFRRFLLYICKSLLLPALPTAFPPISLASCSLLAGRRLRMREEGKGGVARHPLQPPVFEMPMGKCIVRTKNTCNSTIPSANYSSENSIFYRYHRLSSNAKERNAEPGTEGYWILRLRVLIPSYTSIIIMWQWFKWIIARYFAILLSERNCQLSLEISCDGSFMRSFKGNIFIP